MTEKLIDQFRSEGWALLERWCSDQAEENLHLDFKTLSHSDGTLSKDDRKLIAKALSGFANAEGGLLVIGIETEKQTTGFDQAKEFRLVNNVARLAGLVRASLGEMLSPEPKNIEVHEVNSPGNNAKGCLVIWMPESHDRPHMSVPEHRYFRRGSNATRVMEHREISDLFHVRRSGELDVILRPKIMGHSWQGRRCIFSISLGICLSNIGAVPVRASFLRAASQFAPAQPSRQMGSYFHPVSSKKMGKFNSTTDFVLHPKDVFEVAYIPWYFFADMDQQKEPILKAELEMVIALGGTSIRFNHESSSHVASEIFPEISFQVGGLDSPMRSGEIKLDKIVLAQQIADQLK